MRSIAFALALATLGVTAGPSMSSETGTSPNTVVAAIPAAEDMAWKRLEEEQARRRQRRGGPESEPALTLKPVEPAAVAAPSAAKPTRSKARAAESRPVRTEATPPRTTRPRPSPVRVASAGAPSLGSRAAACFRQVGIHVDAAGRPVRESAALSDARSQDAFIRCVDGRY